MIITAPEDKVGNYPMILFLDDSYNLIKIPFTFIIEPFNSTVKDEAAAETN